MMNLPELGDVIDDTYEIKDILGKGGMGAVYLARQINMDRDVAMKILVASGPKFDEMVKRFRREVMAIRNLSHPNTVRIYDFRDDPEGLLYYTMEALRGETLKDLMRREGAISPRRVKHVLRQVLKSLSEAHSYGIVHRDLKPANIMLVDMHGETDFAKVLDFGIAKVFSESGEDEELTSAGIVVGTLRYMAPEQIAEKHVGPPTDLYGLGLIAIEMLSGQSVFAGTGQWNLIHQQISDDPVPIPDPILNTALGQVLKTCVEKSYESRFPTADAMLKALDQIPERDLQVDPLFERAPGGEGWVAVATGQSAGGVRTAPVDDAATMITESPFAGDGSMPAPRAGGFAQGQQQQRVAPQSQADVTGSGSFGAPGAVASQPVSGQFNAPASQSQPFATGSDAHALPQMGTFQSAEPASKSKVVPIAIVVLLLLGGAAGAWVMTQGQGESDPAAGGEEVAGYVAPAEEQAAPAAAQPEEQAAEEAVAAEEVAEETQLVRVRSEGVRAMVFIDDQLMGRTPISVEVGAAPVALRLEATGYETQSAMLEPGGPDDVDLTMVEEEQEEVEEAVAERERSERAPTDSSRSGSSARESGARAARERERERQTPEPAEPEEASAPAASDGWVDLGAAAPRDDSGSKKTKKTTSASDDWVDIAMPEPEKEEEVDIPLF